MSSDRFSVEIGYRVGGSLFKSASEYNPWTDPEVYRAGLEGARGGASIATNALTLGLSDWLRLTDSKQYQGPEYTASRVAAGIGSTALPVGGVLRGGKAALTGIRSGAPVIGSILQGTKQIPSVYKSVIPARGVTVPFLRDVTLTPGTINAASWLAGGGRRLLNLTGTGLGKVNAFPRVAKALESVSRQGGRLDKGIQWLRGTGGTAGSKSFTVADRLATLAGGVATFTPKTFTDPSGVTYGQYSDLDSPYFGALARRVNEYRVDNAVKDYIMSLPQRSEQVKRRASEFLSKIK